MKSCVTRSLLLASMISLGSCQNTVINIQSLNLQSPPGQQTLRCGGHYTFAAAASVSIQTPRYPRKYPNGRRGRCSWFFSLPEMTEVSMVCDSFRVRRGDRFCIDNNQAGVRQCYYGSNDRTFYFPLNLSSSTNVGNRYSVEMKFRPNKKKSSKGFRFVSVTCNQLSILSISYLQVCLVSNDQFHITTTIINNHNLDHTSSTTTSYMYPSW